MTGIDWQAMWVPSLPLLELVIRGSVVYMALFFYFRLLRREAGGIGIADVLVVVLVADASQNAMSSEYTSITEGLVLIATIGSWEYLLNLLGYRFPFIEKLLRPAPLLLIRNGRLLHRNLRKEMITEMELMSQLREQGIDDPADVEKSFLEGDGRLSVISRKGGRHSPRKPLVR